MAVQVKQNLCAIIDPGEMDRLIDIIPVTLASSDSGSITEVEGTEISVRAKVELAAGMGSLDEDMEAMRMTEMTTKNFIIRYMSGITAKHRIRYENQIYDILGLEELGRRQFLRIKADNIVE